MLCSFPLWSWAYFSAFKLTKPTRSLQLIRPQRPVGGSPALAVPVQQLLDSGSEAVNLLATLSMEQLDNFTTAVKKAKDLKEQQQQLQQLPAQNTAPSAGSRSVAGRAPSRDPARKGAKLPHISVITTGPRGPPPATAATLAQRDNVPWMTFSYSRKGHTNTPYSIRIDIDQMNLNDIPQDLQTRNCLYPMANGPEHAYKGVRREYERECNVQGWKLAHLNRLVLDGERGLLQRAVNSFRNLDEGNRSRRMKRRDKVANGTLQKRAARPLMDFQREGVEMYVQAVENRDRGQERSNEDAEADKVARERAPVGLKWKQILVPPPDGSSQGPTDLVVIDPSLPDDTPPQEATIAASSAPPPPLTESTNIAQASLPVSLSDSPDNINLLEFQGYAQGQFQLLQIIVSIDQVPLDSLDFEFKKRNCVYPRSFLDTYESPHWNTFGIRQAEESYLNEIGWKLVRKHFSTPTLFFIHKLFFHISKNSEIEFFYPFYFIVLAEPNIARWEKAAPPTSTGCIPAKIPARDGAASRKDRFRAADNTAQVDLGTPACGTTVNWPASGGIGAAAAAGGKAK